MGMMMVLHSVYIVLPFVHHNKANTTSATVWGALERVSWDPIGCLLSVSLSITGTCLLNCAPICRRFIKCGYQFSPLSHCSDANVR